MSPAPAIVTLRSPPDRLGDDDTWPVAWLAPGEDGSAAVAEGPVGDAAALAGPVGLASGEPVGALPVALLLQPARRRANTPAPAARAARNRRRRITASA
jgi:hypothetical protein